MRTLYKIIIVLAILFVSFEIGIAIPGSFIYALITLIIIAGIINYIISIYNDLVTKRNRVKNSWSKIDVQLKRRTDLIPNLVASVKAYMGHENEILTRIAELRSKATNASESEQIKEGTEISSLLARLNVTVENYPELKANQQFLHLQFQIEDMENELQAIRRTYNTAATDYNNYIEMFPSSIIASWRKHEQQELVEFPESEIKEVKVGELFK